MASFLSGCNTKPEQKLEPAVSLRDALAQKLMLDLRYYCEPDELIHYKSKSSSPKPMTQLPDELAEMIRDTSLGGVILFSENLQQAQQIVRLNHEMQMAASGSRLKLPLFISVDQEGGRVARLPREQATSLSGNMAVGATYDKHGVKFAEQSGEVLGAELNALGFNVNHAPTVDVNVNPKNPVINVRSFGEDPGKVSDLGLAMLKSMQAQGVIGTLKHFPGHGDTSVDSHTGLPRVDHDIDTISRVDLAPFTTAIEAGAVSMLMTAHIQYPALDASTFTNSNGERMIKPATMSKAILTDLLRGKMGYQGLVITDALDMAGISDFMSETQAVIHTLAAGADIALMPIKIRSRQDIESLNSLLDALELAVLQGRLDESQIMASFERVRRVKHDLGLARAFSLSISDKLKQASIVLGSPRHKGIEQALAEASITLVKGRGQLNPDVKRLHLVLPDSTKCAALSDALNGLNPELAITCGPSYETDINRQKSSIEGADAVLVGNITPKQSPVEMGGVEDWHKFRMLGRFKTRQDDELQALLQHAQSLQKQTLFVSLRAPYEIQRYKAYCSDMIATFAYNSHMEQGDDGKKRATGPTYVALAKLLTGGLVAEGTLPVSIGH